MVKKYSNKNELQKQLITIYNNFKNGNYSNRQAKKASNILNILSKINDNEIINRELEKYVFNNRLISNYYKGLNYHLTIGEARKLAKKQAKTKAKKTIKQLDKILLDDFKQEIKSDNEKSKIINLSNIMAKNEILTKLKNL